MMLIKSSISDLPNEVLDVLDRSDHGFFVSYAWFVNFTKTVTDVDKENGFFIYDAAVSHVFPLRISNRKGLRVISGISNYYAPIFSVFPNRTDSYQSDGFFKAFKNELKDWDVMELRPVSLEEVRYLKTKFKSAGLPALDFFCFGNWYLRTSGLSFQEYYSNLPSKLRNTIERKSKKFFKADQGRIDIIKSGDELDRGFADYFRVYASSWKVQEPYPDFILGLMQLAESANGLRLGIAYWDQVPVAAQLWIVADNTAYIYKLAYDENYKNLSAGSILTAKLMQYVFEVDRVDTVDYLTGDDEYKKDWMSDRRERFGLLVFNTSTPKGWWEFCKEMTKVCLKKLRTN